MASCVHDSFRNGRNKFRGKADRVLTVKNLLISKYKNTQNSSVREDYGVWLSCCVVKELYCFLKIHLYFYKAICKYDSFSEMNFSSQRSVCVEPLEQAHRSIVS